MTALGEEPQLQFTPAQRSGLAHVEQLIQCMGLEQGTAEGTVRFGLDGQTQHGLNVAGSHATGFEHGLVMHGGIGEGQGLDIDDADAEGVLDASTFKASFDIR